MFCEKQDYIFPPLCLNSNLLNHIKQNLFLTQAIASVFAAIIVYVFPSLYATLVCVPCSQLEKLRAALLHIKQTHVRTDHYSGEDNYHYSERHTNISGNVIQHLRKQINDCIRHHQNIQRYDNLWKYVQFKSLSLFRKIMKFNNFSDIMNCWKTQWIFHSVGSFCSVSHRCVSTLSTLRW